MQNIGYQGGGPDGCNRDMVNANKAKLMLGFIRIAERTRFELVVGLLLRQFSKLVVSATHPPLQNVLSVLRSGLLF